MKLSDSDDPVPRENLFGSKAGSSSLNILNPNYLKIQSPHTLLPGANGSPPVTSPFQTTNQFLGLESNGNNWPLIQSKIESLNK